jgi:hypothetical protein
MGGMPNLMDSGGALGKDSTHKYFHITPPVFRTVGMRHAGLNVMYLEKGRAQAELQFEYQDGYPFQHELLDHKIKHHTWTIYYAPSDPYMSYGVASDPQAKLTSRCKQCGPPPWFACKGTAGSAQ